MKYNFIILLMLYAGAVFPLPITGSFSFGSEIDPNSVTGDLYTDAVLGVTGDIIQVSNPTGDFASILGTADIDIANMDVLYTSMSAPATPNYLYNFFALNLPFGPNIPIDLTVDLIEVLTVGVLGTTGIEVFSHVMIQYGGGNYSSAIMAIEISSGSEGTYSMSGTFKTESVPEPSSLLLVMIGGLGFIRKFHNSLFG